MTLLAVALATDASAQIATGRVSDGATGRPVAGAEISLIGGEREVVRRVVTDSAGLYSVRAPEPGDYWLIADFLGYERLETPLVTLTAERTSIVDFELPVDAIELEGLEVDAQRDEAVRRRVELYGVRVDDLGARFIDRHQIERWQTAEDFGVALRYQGLAGVQVTRGQDGSPPVPAVCVRIRGNRGCALNVLNGQPVSETVAALVPPEALEAVVVLRPAEATLSFGTDGGNGAVLLFTRGASGPG